jgi:HEPN domain-containing protein
MIAVSDGACSVDPNPTALRAGRVLWILRRQRMVDIDKHIANWKGGATEDWTVAGELVDRQRLRHGLFFAHLALEKALKAHVCRQTQDIAPRIHGLVRLAELAGLQLAPAHVDVLAEMGQFNMAGRYPDAGSPSLSSDAAHAYLSRGREVFEWLMNRL